MKSQKSSNTLVVSALDVPIRGHIFIPIETYLNFEARRLTRPCILPKQKLQAPVPAGYRKEINFTSN